MSSVTALSNYIQITISNHPNDGTHTFKYRKDFSKPTGGGSTTVSLSDIEKVTPSTGLSYVTNSVTINGSPVSTTGPWSLDLTKAPFKVVINQTVTGDLAGLYLLNNKARIGDLCDDVDVEILVKERPLGKICGIKYVDLDCDGVRDPGEPGLSGVLIVLWKDLVPVGSQLSNADGYFEFTGLCPGHYKVMEMGAAGYYPSTSPFAFLDLCWGDAKTVEFGNAPYGSISGYKYDDLDGDGDWDQNEPAIEGWEITLDGETTVKTDSSGYFEFDKLDLRHLRGERRGPRGLVLDHARQGRGRAGLRRRRPGHLRQLPLRPRSRGYQV